MGRTVPCEVGVGVLGNTEDIVANVNASWRAHYIFEYDFNFQMTTRKMELCMSPMSLIELDTLGNKVKVRYPDLRG